MEKSFVISQAEGIFEQMVGIRRQLHKNPEMGRAEFKTQQLIMDFLTKEGIPHAKCADTGVVATINGQPGGKVVAMRADIDALPIQETNQVDYKSCNDGVMHACGHDVHTTINLGAAKVLNDNRDKWKGTVKLFFQPAVEGDGGALRMVNEGCMENPKVDSVIGLHVMPNYNYNQVEYRYGTLNASTDSVRLTVKGKRGHGAYPDRCVDAIIIAAQILVTLQTAVSRNVSPLDSAVFTAGVIKGGEAGNIVADEVTIRGTIRASRPEVKKIMYQKVEAIAKNVAQAMGGDCDVWLSADGYLPLINDSQVLDVILAQARDYLGEDNLFLKESMSMGGEDFSFFNENTPGAFYHLGCRQPGRDEEYFLHTANFDVDERCITTGVVLEVMSAIKLMGN